MSVIVALSTRMAGIDQILGQPARHWIAADKADRRHSGRDRGGDAGHRIFDHDAGGRIDLQPRRGEAEQIGRRLAVGHVA
jgi:hypothetical protein